MCLSSSSHPTDILISQRVNTCETVRASANILKVFRIVYSLHHSFCYDCFFFLSIQGIFNIYSFSVSSQILRNDIRKSGNNQITHNEFTKMKLSIRQLVLPLAKTKTQIRKRAGCIFADSFKMFSYTSVFRRGQKDLLCLSDSRVNMGSNGRKPFNFY